MKKVRFFALFLCLISSIPFVVFSGCSKTNPLYDYVSELRLNLYQGSCEDFTLKAGYGFRENPYHNDGEVSKKVYQLTFRLLNKDIDDITYTLKLNFNSQTYSGTFALDPISNAVTTKIEVENFNLNEFTVTLSYGGTEKEIIMTSLLPQGTITYQTALDKLHRNETALINAFTDQNGKFTAEIYMRIIVKEQKPYWYIGFANGNDRLKAMLMDGFTGELLAVREVF